MTGKVVSTRAAAHVCRPGCTVRYATGQGKHSIIPAGMPYLDLPTRWSHPPGTVWECDCGRAWVSWRPAGADAAGRLGQIWWRRESRWARWRRRRRSASKTP